MDNACRDNKNKYVLTFFSLLVELGIFKKVKRGCKIVSICKYISNYIQVKIGFLPVGHTHEDIDQLFSCVSRHLKRRNALTVPGKCPETCVDVCILFSFGSVVGLAEVIKTSFTPEPTTLILDSVVDVKGWMKDVTPALHDHLKAHHFKFNRNEEGECKMFYKEWSTDKFWLPQSGLSLLPAGNAIINMLL